jgi:nucleoside-diphosphate-sugar epimerase
MRELLDLVGDAVGVPVKVERHEAAPGDAQRTGGSSARATEVLGWAPSTPLAVGVAEMVAWCSATPRP